MSLGNHPRVLALESQVKSLQAEVDALKERLSNFEEMVDAMFGDELTEDENDPAGL